MDVPVCYVTNNQMVNLMFHLVEAAFSASFIRATMNLLVAPMADRDDTRHICAFSIYVVL